MEAKSRKTQHIHNIFEGGTQQVLKGDSESGSSQYCHQKYSWFRRLGWAYKD